MCNRIKDIVLCLCMYMCFICVYEFYVYLYRDNIELENKDK